MCVQANTTEYKEVLTLILAFLVSLTVTYYDYNIPPIEYMADYYLGFTEQEKELLFTTQSFVPATCQPIHVSATFRHCSRYPSSSHIEDAKELVAKLKGNVHNAEYGDLNDIYVRFPVEDAGEISPVGKVEMQEMAQRYAKRFTTLIGEAAKREKLFYSSDFSRVYESMEEFQKGLNEALDKNMMQKIEIRNDIIRFMDDCECFTESLVNNATATYEADTYAIGPELQNLAATIGEKLQLSE